MEKYKKDEKSLDKKQKINILVSIFRCGDKIISSLGIPKSNTVVEHIISKKILKEDEIFNIISHLTTDSYFNRNQAWKSVVKDALDKNCTEIYFPATKTNELSKYPIGKLIHEVIKVDMEIGIK